MVKYFHKEKEGGRWMKRIKLTKIIVYSLMVFSSLIATSTGASAEWKSNSKGWWYTEGNSYSKGWKLINGNWYYFNNDGYMAHDTTIDGYYLNSSGAWENSVNSIIGQGILKNVSVQNPSFNIEIPSGGVEFNKVGDIIKGEIEKLKITNSYEMYNVKNYNLNMSARGNGPIVIKVNCSYRMSAQMEADLNTKVKVIISNIAPDNMSQPEKERAIHDWIVNNTRYDQSYTIYDPYNTLIKHTGVCEGYSLLAQKMFTVAGIKSIIVAGTAGGEDHAWNMVFIDNKWRHVDCTWDDPIAYKDILQYDYYNLTDKEISSDHTWDTSVYPKAN